MFLSVSYSYLVKRYLMQSFHGSMRYDQSGRKRKTKAWSTRKRTPEFKPMQSYSVGPDWRRETPKYESAPLTPYSPDKDTTFKLEESKNFTVAPAYNKGAYQVIPKSDIKHIGK
jgi:hypothetical protein